MTHGHLFHFVVWHDTETNTYTTREKFDDLTELKKRPFLWAHINRAHPNCVKALQMVHLHRPTIMALTDENTRPRYDILPNGYLTTLRGINLNPNTQLGEEEHDLIAVRAFFTHSVLVTVGKRSLKAVKDMYEDFKNKNTPPRIMNPLNILAGIIQHIAFSMAQLLSQYDDQIDSIEDESLKSFDKDFRQKIIEKRLAILQLRRYITPQKDVVNSFLNMPEIQQNMDLLQHMKISYDYYTRFCEDLDVMRERLQLLLEEIRNNISEIMNRNLYVLSIITIIFIPAGFLTGLFGINVGGMPGLNNPDAFWTFTASITVLCLIEAILLKRLRLLI